MVNVATKKNFKYMLTSIDYDKWIQSSNDNFIVGEDSFGDLEIHPTPINNFYYFFSKKDNKLVKQFILNKKNKVDYVCKVILIKKGDKFTPRLAVSVRNKAGKIVDVSKDVAEITERLIKANVNLDECHENFWHLISFLESLRQIEIPRESFSLVSQAESEIVKALRSRGVGSVLSIIKQLSLMNGVSLSENDINQILKRKEKLTLFDSSITEQSTDEKWWQDFFENNKWIFGYGLNYQILRQEQDQPYYGGTSVDGKGGQRGDYLTSTVGDLNFTVLVEIKTPDTPLLQGDKEIRSGAWSLSKKLTDALSQIQANIDIWDKQGSKQADNVDKLEKENVFTVQPKGIIVIGQLGQLESRSKRETFQRFRKSLHGVDILTFDELLNRARFIVDEKTGDQKIKHV